MSNDDQPTEPEESETQWTDAARVAYAARAEEFIARLREHVQLTVGLSRGEAEDEAAEEQPYDVSSQRLYDAAAAFDHAEYEWCDQFPLALDDGEWPDDDDDDAAVSGGRILTVAGRWDYVVTNADEFIAAGRAGYLRAWPDDTEDDAAKRVDGPAMAASEIAHADGWGALDEAPGLDSIAAVVTTIVHDDGSASWLDDHDEDPFAITREEGHIQFRTIER